ncbi:MAG: tetratricopeptide repeat protein, partial [Nitrospirota bacterium]|nr:tetratricopeptide repeat protein [Nitrospirota bacterium]
MFESRRGHCTPIQGLCFYDRRSKELVTKKKEKEQETRAPNDEEKLGTVYTGSEAGDRTVDWMTHHRRQLTIGAVTLFLVGGGVWFTQAAQVRKENFAARELSQARTAADAGNFQLAASDLNGIIGTYGRTPAAQEAVILLANVHLQQGQAALAAAELQDFLNGGPQREFRAPAAGLLGSAWEELGDFSRAADAFEQAVDAMPYAMIRSQYLMDLGRAASISGDPARAAAAYERIIEDNDDPRAV